MLIRARISLQTFIDECYKYFIDPIDFRRLPGVHPDTFGLVVSRPEFSGVVGSFEQMMSHWHNVMSPHGDFMMFGQPDVTPKLSWNGEVLDHLALVGSDTMGIGSGGGFIVLRTTAMEHVVAHMRYNNLGFAEDSIFGIQGLRIDLGEGKYGSTAGLYKIFVLPVSLKEATSRPTGRR